MSKDTSPARCRVAASPTDRAACMAIRFEVFVDEQRVPPELEPDEYDDSALHLLAYDPDTEVAVGTARLVDKGNGLAKIGRVAVRRAWRGSGVGAALMRFALAESSARGFTMAALDAQTYVIPFYERLGFAAEGPVFDDAGIPHRHMRRAL
ncbi:MAG: GNAT family N-acetyltransferase [Cytophagales bacterium]|nr:GNAT family N-acetyltransferase [Armatimonadota bacterium]